MTLLDNQTHVYTYMVFCILCIYKLCVLLWVVKLTECPIEVEFNLTLRTDTDSAGTVKVVQISDYPLW
jgi:hypothetical protein